jgi:hypothetical protein
MVADLPTKAFLARLPDPCGVVIALDFPDGRCYRPPPLVMWGVPWMTGSLAVPRDKRRREPSQTAQGGLPGQVAGVMRCRRSRRIITAGEAMKVILTLEVRKGGRPTHQSAEWQTGPTFVTPPRLSLAPFHFGQASPTAIRPRPSWLPARCQYICARGPLGTKPLLYAVREGRLDILSPLLRTPAEVISRLAGHDSSVPRHPLIRRS